MVSRPFRRRPASSPTQSRRKSCWGRAIKRPRCCRRLPERVRFIRLPLWASHCRQGRGISRVGRVREGADVDARDVVLVIDNYDSFTYNLVQYLGELGERVVVHRNNEITLREVTDLHPVAAVLSPGPGTPGDAGICKDLLLELGPTLPTLGVCLWHQCLGEAYGGQVRRAPQGVDGKGSAGLHPPPSGFCGLSNPVRAT